jgi:hypothetical protein
MSGDAGVADDAPPPDDVSGGRAGLLERLIAAPIRFGRDWFLGFVALQGFDRAVALAGQAFTALIPLLIVYAAVVSRASGNDFADEIVRIFHLDGNAESSVRQAFAPRARSRARSAPSERCFWSCPRSRSRGGSSACTNSRGGSARWASGPRSGACTGSRSSSPP